MKKLKVVEVLQYNGVNMKVISTKTTYDYSQDGFITLKHASSLFILGGHELLMSLKTWASGEVPRASKI